VRPREGRGEGNSMALSTLWFREGSGSLIMGFSARGPFGDKKMNTKKRGEG
jgi:hypothetical protein